MSLPSQVDTAALLEELRRHDPDRALCLALAPAARRHELAALVLFDYELARVPAIVRTPLAGLVRYRFWRDQLAAAAAGRPCDHPLPRILATPLREGRLALPDLEALITARADELDGLLEPGIAPTRPPLDLDTLETWARTTGGGLARAMAGLLGTPATLATAAEAAGTAFGLIGIVRATLVEAGRERRIAGRSLVDLAGLEPAVLRAPEPPPAPRALIGDLVDRAERAIAATRRLAGRPPRRWLAPLLLATVAEVRARELRRAGLDPRRLATGPGTPLLPARLLRAWLTRSP